MAKVLFITGAGLSVESGIRAFRTDSDSGKAMWDEYDIDEVCNLQSFDNGFRYYKEGIGANGAVDEDGLDLYTKTHDFYNKRRQELENVDPNIAHLQIGEWYKRYPDKVLNMTTNVDDLLERSGIPYSKIDHLHGYLLEVLTKKDNYGSPTKVLDVGYSDFDFTEYFWAKPAVTFFYESAPWYQGQVHTLDDLDKGDLVVVVGCSNIVINFNWEIFPLLNKGISMAVVNPDIKYHEQEEYESRGVPVFRAGAVETFSNKNFIAYIETFLTK